VAYVPRYQTLARELSIYIVPGTIVKPVEPIMSPAPGQYINDKAKASRPLVTELRNMAYFITASTGDILSTYQKKNLWYCWNYRGNGVHCKGKKS
jgi:hypothetical protein